MCPHFDADVNRLERTGSDARFSQKPLFFRYLVDAADRGRMALDGVKNGPTRTRTWHQRRAKEHTSELQSLMRISYAVFCLQTNTKPTTYKRTTKMNQKT